MIPPAPVAGFGAPPRDGKRGFGEVVDRGGLEPDTGQGIASSHWHQGAAGAVVDVDRETGRIQVRHVHASIYAGKVVRRAAAELQNEGSIIMGLGTALFETILYDGGQVINANLSDYNIPSPHDLPRITHDLIEREDGEVNGLGETALPPIPAAIGNALYASGIHQTALPMTAERVLAAIDRAAADPGSPVDNERVREIHDILETAQLRSERT
jgi:CO/xanthine dehydrogenase Mo-binding subunit